MRTYFVDAFTTRRFTGNPAAVCVVEARVSDALMQDIAREIGFSETAFVTQRGAQQYGIRFFTPKQEIALCGHATLAAAKVLFDSTRMQRVRFTTAAGVALFAETRDDGAVAMRFPRHDAQPVAAPPALLLSLGIDNAEEVRLCEATRMLLVTVASAHTLAALQPDFRALVRSYHGIDGVVVSAPGPGDGFDFHYRYFWPWAGTPEDPVTGAVQTFLTPYWSARVGSAQLRCFQSSARTGAMRTELTADSVWIVGQAVTVLTGEMSL